MYESKRGEEGRLGAGWSGAGGTCLSSAVAIM